MLAVAASQPVAEKAPSRFIVAVLALGLVVLLVTLAGWIIQWARRRLEGRGGLPRLAPARPNTLGAGHVMLLVAFWMGGMIAAQGLALWLWGKGPAAQDDIRVSLISQPIVQMLWLASSLAVAWMTFPGGLRSGLGLSARHWVADLVRAVVTYLAVLPLCIGARALMVLLLPPTLIHIHPYLEALPALAPPWKLLLIFSAVVMAALSEELFFRGILQSFLRRHMKGWLAILIASAVFMMFHYSMVQDLPSLFLLAVALGYSYERTGRLLAPIVVHALFNAVSIGETLQ